MSITPGGNAACCTIPPVQSNYKPKGKFETINGISTYVVGDKACKQAIIVVMDIFGMVPLTQQGCDVLASQGFYLLMPDYLDDQALQAEDIPLDTPEKIAKGAKLFSGAGNPQVRAADLSNLGEKLKSEGFIVGALGFCWGAKVSILASGSDQIAAVAAVHPALLAREDATICKAPLGLYPSRDENPAEMEPFIKVAKEYKLYSDVHHGFAAARAKLDDPQCKAAYEDVYQNLTGFFKKYLL